MKYLAKPNTMNFEHSKVFDTKKECQKYLNSWTRDDASGELPVKMYITDWEYLGKIVEMDD